VHCDEAMWVNDIAIRCEGAQSSPKSESMPPEPPLYTGGNRGTVDSSEGWIFNPPGALEGDLVGLPGEPTLTLTLTEPSSCNI